MFLNTSVSVHRQMKCANITSPLRCTPQPKPLSLNFRCLNPTLSQKRQHKLTTHKSRILRASVEEHKKEAVSEMEVKAEEKNEDITDGSSGETTKTESKEEVIEEGKEKEEVAEEPEYIGPGALIVNKLRFAMKQEKMDTGLLKSIVNDTMSQCVALAERARETEEKVSKIESEADMLKGKFLRLNADFDNFRKRSTLEREQVKMSTKSDIVGEMLPLIDNFELARKQVKPETEGEEKIMKNFMSLYRQMVDLFTLMGLEAVESQNKPFNPEIHEAIMREENDSVPDGTVVEELRKGFMIGGKLLRPSMVKVSFSNKPWQEPEEGKIEIMPEEYLKSKENEGSAEEEVESKIPKKAPESAPLIAGSLYVNNYSPLAVATINWRNGTKEFKF